MVAQAALAGAAGEMMLHAMSVKDPGFTAVQLHRHRHTDQALRPFAALAQVVGKREKPGHLVELGRGHRKNRIRQQFFLHHREPRGVVKKWARQESNLYLRLRRPSSYPLDYGPMIIMVGKSILDP